jgi:hypothetical protein
MNSIDDSTVSEAVQVSTSIDSDTVSAPVLPSKRKRGRPPKAEVQAKLKPGKVGRPKGDFQKARELCARMLVSEGDRMLRTLIEMALTDGHPNQIPALKMCLDRALPISYFESHKDSAGPGGSGIVINISGINQSPQIETTDNVIDVEVGVQNGRD